MQLPLLVCQLKYHIYKKVLSVAFRLRIDRVKLTFCLWMLSSYKTRVNFMLILGLPSPAAFQEKLAPIGDTELPWASSFDDPI